MAENTMLATPMKHASTLSNKRSLRDFLTTRTNLCLHSQYSTAL